MKRFLALVQVVAVMVVVATLAYATPSANAADNSGVHARVLPSRCTDNGDTVVRIRLTHPGPGVGHANYNTDSGGYRFDQGWVDNFNRHTLRFKVLPNEKIRVNVWGGKDTSGNVLLDVTKRALLCHG